MNYETRELNDTELEVVAGGMDCQTALNLAGVYTAVSPVLNVAGDSVGAAAAAGTAQGLITGGCGK